MRRNVLSSEEYKLIKEILTVTTSLQKLYKNLYQLEISSKKDSDEYKKNLNYLKMVLEVEKDLYKKVDKDFAEKIVIVINRFLNNYSSEVVKRILNNMNMNFIFDESSVIELLSDEIIDPLIEDSLENLNDESFKFVASCVDLYKMFRNDVLMASLIVLKEFLIDDNYEKIRNKLIRYKYNISFKNKSIETNLLDNDFEIPDILNVISETVSYFCLINKEEYDLIKDSFYLNGISCEIEDLLKMKDSDFNNEKGQILLIIKQCLLRGYFLLMEDETIEDVDDKFHSILGEDEYLDEHYYDVTSERTIITSLKMVENDKNKKMVLKVNG